MSVSRRASFAAGIAAVRRQKRAHLAARRDMEALEEDEDTNHIMVVPGGGAPLPLGTPPEAAATEGQQKQFQKPAKPKMQSEIRAFTKESLEKINLRTANLIRDYGYLPKRAAHLEDGAELPMKFEPFPAHLLGKPVEEIDQFVYEKTFCTVSRRFQKPFIQRFSASSSLFIFPPWNCFRKTAIYLSVNQYFDYLVMLTILANCAFLAMTEPINEAEIVFLAIYSVEMVIKVIAKGFILNNYTYLRNPWNWLDFIVILSGYLTSFVELGNLAGLRTFRVLRALKTVSIMPGLKTIINALLHSVKQLAEVMTLTVFCLMVFALFALQVYMGQLRNKCVLTVPPTANWSVWVQEEENWFKVNGEPELCGNASGARSCPHGFVCLHSIGENPNYGFTSFDNLLWSMLTTFQLITLDYWENVYNMVVATGGPIHVIFFTIVVFFGSFYLINLMLAVVAMSYEEEAELMNVEKARELEEAKQVKQAQGLAGEECTIRTNSPKFGGDGSDGCGQCTSHATTEEKKEKPARLVVRAGQAGTELRSVGLAGGPGGLPQGHLTSGAAYQAKFNITVPLHGHDRPLLSPSSSMQDHSMSDYSDATRSGDSSVNDSGVVGDHDQDSLYDLTINNMEQQPGAIINCKDKERKPSKIDIPFVVSIETGSDRNCAGCRTCCLDYNCWLKTQDILYTIINDTFFDVIVTLCIILNTIFLAIEHHGMSEELSHILDLGNKVFTTFFALEAVLKLAALSREYFGNGWNIFDLVIVVASLLDLGLESVDGISVLRGMRLMRVLKLAQSWTTMKVLLSIIISTLGALGNLTFILLIVIYIFAILGMQLFGKDYTAENFHPDPIPRWNFTDFFHSFMMIFRILCGEWIEPLWDCMRVQKRVGTPESCLAIFIPALVVGNFMVLNLFLALLLNSFNSDELKQRKEEVETTEKNMITVKLDAFKEKIKKARADLRVKVGLPALDSTSKFPSNGSLLSQNGIKYNSEPELASTRVEPGDQEYHSIREGGTDTLERPQSASDKGLSGRSLSERDINDICHKSKSLTFSGGERCPGTDVVLPTGPDPCCPELCMKMCCTCCEGTWIQGKWDFLRSCIHDIVDNPFFEWTILLLIFASSLSLCFEDINLQDNEELKFILKIVNLVFAVLFAIEMFLKWIAFGLWRYFGSVWTCLDFVIVIVSVVSLAVEGNSNLTAFRSLRTLRALRPLRAISRWQGMKIVVNALMYAIPSIINVLLVCLVFWLIFSIMGVQFFGGKFYKCVDDEGVRLEIDVVNDRWECAEKNYTWVNSKITFDHVGHAYLALFQVATFEGWMEIMADAVDAREVDQQPQYEASLYNYFYFVIFIVCGSFFTLNLFIGVIIDNFNALKKKYEGGVLEMFLTESQKHYYTAMKKLGRKKPQKVIKRPQNPYHALFYDISLSRRFEIAIFVLIFLNMVSMGIEHYDQSRAVTFALEICNALFTTIFSLEATVKVIGLRHHYFTAAWNLFDFILVIASIVGILMEDLMTDFPVSPTLLRVVRVFRIGRILRLIKAAKGIRKLLFALIVSLPALFNIGALLALITFIYAIIGMTIFGHVKHQGALDDLVNFETFGRSMQVLFRLVTSAGWNDVLDPLMTQPPECDPLYKDLPNGNCGFPWGAIVFFVTFIIINFMIVINMYIAIILENFNQAHQEEEIGIVEEDLEMFYGKWSKFDPHATQFITFNQMSDFIGSLDPPLGIPKPNSLAIVSFDLPIAKGDKIHCLDVLHALTKYTLGFIEDESEDFQKLTEQMDEKFKKQFPTRKELEIVSSTREWKKLDTAARVIQKFYRMYISSRERTLGNFEPRIDTETQTRRAALQAEDTSPRSVQCTETPSPAHSEPVDTDLEQEELQDVTSSQFPTGDSHNTQLVEPERREEYYGEEDYHYSDSYQYEEKVDITMEQVQDQYERQADVRHQIDRQYHRGPGAHLAGETQPGSGAHYSEPGIQYTGLGPGHYPARDTFSVGGGQYSDSGDQYIHSNREYSSDGGQHNSSTGQYTGSHTQAQQLYIGGQSGESSHVPDYIRPVFPSAGGKDGKESRSEYNNVQNSAVQHSKEHAHPTGYSTMESLDHPHYHEWEDEVCLKCDTAAQSQSTSAVQPLPRPATSLGRPVTGMARPATSLGRPATSLGRPLTALGRPTTAMGRPATALPPSLPSLPSVEVQDYSCGPSYVRPVWGPSQGRQLPQAPVLRRQGTVPGQRPRSEYGPPRHYPRYPTHN